MDNYALMMLVNGLFLVGIAAGIAGVVIATVAIIQRLEHQSLQKLTAALAAARSELEEGR